MVDVADLGDSADKFERRASAAGQDYANGVESVTDSEQQEATLEAADEWVTGVQESIQNGTFQSGVRNTPKSWQSQALEVGQNRFTQSAGQSGDVWRQSFEPFANALESLSIPPRGARGSSANFERSREVGERLNEARSEV